MKWKEVFLFGALVAALTLSACTNAQPYVVKPNISGVTVTVEELQKYQHVSSEMVVSPGDMFSVILGSTPSTGYAWVLTSDPVRLMQIGHQTLGTTDTSIPTVDSGGREVWVFEAVGKGKTIVSLEYSEPSEGGKKGMWTFELTVTVQ